MAYSFHPHHLLLFLVAIMATNLHLISTTAPSPSPSSPPSTPPLSPPPLPTSSTTLPPPSPPSTPPPLPTSSTTLPTPSPGSPPTILSPPPPPPPSDFQQKQLNNIIDALIGAGDFAGWANFISSTDPSSLPLTATLFIPSNDAISHLPTATATAAGINFDPFIIPYHIVPQRLSFQELQRFTTHTRLPTLLPSKYIIVTNNSPTNFTIDDSQITHPDMYVTAAFSVHGIKNILDYALYGDGNIFPPPDQAPPSFTPSQAVPPPHSTAGEFVFGGQRVNAACSSTEFAFIFSLFCAAFVLKIIEKPS